MFTLVLVPLLAVLIAAISVRAQGDDVDRRLTGLLLGSYALRLAVSPVTHTIPIFSTPSGIDSGGYEGLGRIIARQWTYEGVHYIGGNDLPGMEHVSLAPNVFAAVTYLNGGPTHLGCVAVVAAMASFIFLDLHLLSRLLGARRDVALAVTAFISVLPSFLYYTSDTYKDGFASFFVLGILTTSVRLGHKFSVARCAWALLLLAGLWETRYYLVFVMPAPILLGVLGLRSGSVMRTVVAVLVLGTAVVAAFAYSEAPAVATADALKTLQSGTSQAVLDANADTGSGVALGTGPSAFALRLAYTLFSPFPWQSGSLGLQVEKLEVFVWYYFFYRAVQAVRQQWRMVGWNAAIFVVFLGPMTIAYALSFANIGLMVRERLNIVLATITFATVSWSRVTDAVAARRSAPRPFPADPSPRRALGPPTTARGGSRS